MIILASFVSYVEFPDHIGMEISFDKIQAQRTRHIAPIGAMGRKPQTDGPHGGTAGRSESVVAESG